MLVDGWLFLRRANPRAPVPQEHDDPDDRELHQPFDGEADDRQPTDHIGQRVTSICRPCDDRLMDVASMNEVAADQLGKALSADSGRSSVTVYSRPGARLRQTLMALAAGRALGEHKSPGDASLLCLQGRIVVQAGARPPSSVQVIWSPYRRNAMSSKL